MSPIKRAVAMFVIACVVPSLAQAGPITLNDPGIVGAVEGKITASNPTKEEILAEFLLAMAINSTIKISDATPPANLPHGCSDALKPCEYKTGDNVYGPADLTYVDKNDGGTANIKLEHQGNVYIMAKYDGQNAGYILFYLPDWNDNPANTDNVIPKFPGDIFGNQYAISNYVVFSGPKNVPDGGMTISLLGMAMAGMGLIARRMKK